MRAAYRLSCCILAALACASVTQAQQEGSWLSYGRTAAETRYRPLKAIDTSNVSRLGLAWTYVLGAGGGNQEATPLVWNKTL